MHEVEIDSDATGDSRSAYGARALPLQVYGRVTAVRLSALARAHTHSSHRRRELYHTHPHLPAVKLYCTWWWTYQSRLLLTTPQPTAYDIMSVAWRLVGCVALLLVGVVADERGIATSEQEQRDAHEAAAQKALTDSLTDALAMLRHGSPRAKEEAAAGIANMAIETTISQPFHPVTFRNACVRAGILGELVLLLNEASSTRGAKLHALRALEAIATDDPSTELDNGHALAACEAGAVPPAVALLGASEEELQVASAGCVAVLAENPQCQTQLLKQGAVPALVELGACRDGARGCGMHVPLAGSAHGRLRRPPKLPRRAHGRSRAPFGRRCHGALAALHMHMHIHSYTCTCACASPRAWPCSLYRERASACAVGRHVWQRRRQAPLGSGARPARP